MGRWAREDAGLTQGELAKRMGISQQGYARLESPDANFTMATLARAAEALGMRVEIELIHSRSPTSSRCGTSRRGAATPAS